MRLHGKGKSKLSWREAGQPRHLVDVVDSDQEVVNKEFSLSTEGRARVPDLGGEIRELVVLEGQHVERRQPPDRRRHTLQLVVPCRARV